MWYSGYMRRSRLLFILLFCIALASFSIPVFAQLHTLMPLPTATPVPPTLVPGLCQGTKCATAASCPKCLETIGSEQCLGRTQYVCGDCYCSAAHPTSGPCTGGWSACAEQYTGVWCRSRRCPPDLIYQIDCSCPVPTTGSGGGGGGATATPIPPSNTPGPFTALGNITVVGYLVSTSSPTCAQILAGSLLPNSFYATNPYSGPPPSQVQTTGPVSWVMTLADRIYAVIAGYATDEYVPVAYCHNTTSDPTYVVGQSGYLADGDTINFYVGFAQAGPWVQTIEGDVYGTSSLQTSIPSLIDPRVFSRTGAGGSAGVAITGGSMGLSPIPDLSITGQSYTTQNFYGDYAQRLRTTTSHALATPIATLTNLGTETTTVYTITGAASIDSALTVPAGDKVIVLVDGSLTINNSITLGSVDSFVAFIVNGDITVASTVGGTEAAPALTPMI